MGRVRARFQSATYRRDLRRRVRNALGPSSDPAPGAERTLRAASALRDLLEQATNGEFMLRLEQSPDHVSPRRAVTFSEAISDVRERGEES